VTPRLRVESWAAVIGFVAAVALLAALAEGFLRWFPPTEQEPYIGDASPRQGPFVGDRTFGVSYRSFDAFAAVNAERLQPFLPLGTPGAPLWAMFGNSFVQAPGMLGDTLRERVPERRIFYLGRNEDLPVRFAQVALLLDHGLRPERVFVVLLPLDLAGLGVQPLATLQVTSHGALGYQPRLPDGIAGRLLARSALVRAAWFRAGRQRGNPAFDPRALNERIDAPLLGDVGRLFTGLADAAHAHGVPVTVVLIPSYQQVLRGAPYGFQDTLTPLLVGLGYDVCDPRDRFARAASPDLFAPDRHLSPQGNQLLAGAVLAHLTEIGALRDRQDGPQR